MSWEQGCSLKQDGGYEGYLAKRSMAPFAYVMSCRAPAGCPSGGPRFSECRAFAPGYDQVPRETSLRQQMATRAGLGRPNRPHTPLTGTSAFKGAGEAAVSAQGVATETDLRDSEWTGGFCRRTLMERVPHQPEQFLGGFVPRVEPMYPGGLPSRCNKLAYRPNHNNCFVASAPVPPPAVYRTGVFAPA